MRKSILLFLFLLNLFTTCSGCSEFASLRENESGETIGEKVSFQNSNQETIHWICKNRISGRSVSLNETGDGRQTVRITFSDKTEIQISGIPAHWDKYKTIEFQLGYPNLTMENYSDTEKMNLFVEDSQGRSHCVEYPFSNIPWLFDKRPVVSWHINLKEFSDAGVDLSDVRYTSLVMETGAGLVDIYDFKLNNPNVVMDLTRALKPERVTYQEACHQGLGNKMYWGSSLIKDNGVYYIYTSFWDKGDPWWTGAIDCHITTKLFPVSAYEYRGEAITKRANQWGSFAHNPDIFRDDDGHYYFYYLSGLDERSRTIAMAHSDSPEGPWTYVKERVLTVDEHGYPNYDLHRGCTTYGIGNPRIVKKNGVYYLFHKILANFTYPLEVTSCDGSLGYFLYYDLATSHSPYGPFKKRSITGLRGRSTNYPLYQACGMNKPGNWDIEDACFFTYKSMHYAITKDFMGYWNRTAQEDGLVLWESADLINWKVSDFPLITKEVRKVRFADGLRSFQKMERPYLYLEEDGKKGVMTFAIYSNLTIPLEIED